MSKNSQRQAASGAKRPRNSASLEAAWVPITKLKPNPSNTRLHDERSLEGLQASLRQFGQVWPILADKSGMVIAHHGILEALKREGFEEAKVVYAEGMSKAQQRAFVVADNRLAEISAWDEEGLRAELQALADLGFDMDSVGYELAELEAALTEEVERTNALGSLAESFGVPPFTILNCKGGDWQKRKSAWIALGIKSEEGRGENLIGRSPQEIFCFETGMHYDKARKMVTEAIEREGEAFDLGALIAKHRPKGRRNSSDFTKGGAVVEVGKKKSAVSTLLETRAAQKAERIKRSKSP